MIDLHTIQQRTKFSGVHPTFDRQNRVLDLKKSACFGTTAMKRHTQVADWCKNEEFYQGEILIFTCVRSIGVIPLGSDARNSISCRHRWERCSVECFAFLAGNTHYSMLVQSNSHNGFKQCHVIVCSFQPLYIMCWYKFWLLTTSHLHHLRQSGQVIHTDSSYSFPRSTDL